MRWCTCGAHAVHSQSQSMQSYLGVERAALRGELQQRPGAARERHAVERRRLALAYAQH